MIVNFINTLALKTFDVATKYEVFICVTLKANCTRREYKNICRKKYKLMKFNISSSALSVVRYV